MDLLKLRKLVSLDSSDPLSRFALGKKLSESAARPDLEEALEHLRFAQGRASDHLATYAALATTLIKLDRREEARPVLEEGVRRASRVQEGMGRDLAPVMSQMLSEL